jgi:hypothetical protein
MVTFALNTGIGDVHAKETGVKMPHSRFHMCNRQLDTPL